MLYFFFVFHIFISNPDSWQSDFETAKHLAAEQDKKILMVFSGSDWCGPCIKLKKKILLNDSFLEFEKEHLVVLYLDFPKRKKNRLSKEQTKHNEALAEMYNRSGAFPNIILFDSNGEVLKNLSYDGQTPDKFIADVKSSL